MIDFIFCLSGIQIRLINLPRGENIRDARISRSLQSWLESYLPHGVGTDFVYLYNRVTIDINFESEAGNNLNQANDPGSPAVDPSSRVSGQSGAGNAETSDITISDSDNENDPVLNEGVSAEESEVELPRTSRRRMRKVNRKCAVQHTQDTSSENEEHARPLKRRRQRGPAVNVTAENSELPTPSQTRKELAGRTREGGKKTIPKTTRSRKADRNQNSVEEPAQCQPKSKKNKAPVCNGSLPPKDSVGKTISGPSKKRKKEDGNKRKNVNFQNRHPVEESECSDDEPVPCQPRKRPRTEKKK